MNSPEHKHAQRLSHGAKIRTATRSLQQRSVTSSSAGETPRGTREVILNAALRIVGRQGIDGLTIGELAKAVGMSKSGLFAHFGGKDQLQLAVLELATLRFVDIVLRPAFTQPRGEPRIRAMFESWLDHLNDLSALPGSSILIAASTELDERPGLLRDYVQTAQLSLISNIEKAATMAIKERHFRKSLNVEQFAWSLYSFVLGYYHFKRMLEDPKAELHLKRAFKGLLDFAREGASKPVNLKLKKTRNRKRTGV
jgi:AcrR family transcriptional regulator